MTLLPPVGADGADLAAQLAQAQAGGGTLEAQGWALPATLQDAESVQDRVLQRLALQPAAWKLGASTHAAQAALGLTRAFLAPLPAPRVLASPARLAGHQLRQHGMECELGVTLRGLDADERERLARPPAAADLAWLAGLVVACHACIEIPESRFPRLGAAGPLALVADNGAAGWLVVGPAGDPAALSGPARGSLALDGQRVAHGDASAFVAPPLQLVRHFLWQALQRGLLPPGPTVVSLGSVTPYQPVEGPVQVSVTFDGLPPATLTLSH